MIGFIDAFLANDVVPLNKFHVLIKKNRNVETAKNQNKIKQINAENLP